MKQECPDVVQPCPLHRLYHPGRVLSREDDVLKKYKYRKDFTVDERRYTVKANTKKELLEDDELPVPACDFE